MKGFREFCADREQLDEGLARTGAIAGYAAQARQHGEEAEKAFKRAQRILKTGPADLSFEERVLRQEQALYALLDGLIALRKQVGASVAVDMVGHAAQRQKRR